MRLAALVLLAPFACLAQHPHEAERQRALIELDRRASEFATKPLPPQVGQPLHADPELARQLRPYERMRMAEERDVLRLPPPVVRPEARNLDKPLPLPRGPERGVDPVTVPGSRG